MKRLLTLITLMSLPIVYLWSCGEEEEITESGSCTFNFDFSADGGTTYKSCLHYADIEVKEEGDLKSRCETGEPDKNLGKGAWATGECDATGATSTCSGAPFSEGNITLTMYDASFNTFIKDQCEGGKGMFSEGKGTYKELVAETTISATLTSKSGDTTVYCNSMDELSQSIATAFETQYADESSLVWEEEGECETASALASCTNATKSAGYSQSSYWYVANSWTATDETTCTSESGTWTEI